MELEVGDHGSCNLEQEPVDKGPAVVVEPCSIHEGRADGKGQVDGVVDGEQPCRGEVQQEMEVKC